MSDLPAPLGVIETDAFCEGCGFNLHSQKVWRDERLGIAVCRCPECGRHAFAGGKTSVLTVWLQRLALLGTLAWGALALMLVLGTFGYAFGIHAAADEGLTYRRLETVDGRPVQYSYNGNTQEFTIALPQPDVLNPPPPTSPTTVPAEQVVLRRKLAPFLTDESRSDARLGAMYGIPPQLIEAVVIGGMMMLGWLACGMVLAVISWFWRPWRRWLWLLLPTLAAVTVLCLMLNQGESNYWGRGVREINDVPVLVNVGVVLLVNLIVMAIGLIVGRPFMRLLLKVFIPPKPRQLFAFLWHCDGKTMPMPMPTQSR